MHGCLDVRFRESCLIDFFNGEIIRLTRKKVRTLLGMSLTSFMVQVLNNYSIQRQTLDTEHLREGIKKGVMTHNIE